MRSASPRAAAEREQARGDGSASSAGSAHGRYGVRGLVG